MSNIAYLAFQNSGSPAAGVKWNNILNDTTLRNLVDDAGAANGWTGQYIAQPAGSLNGNTDNAVGTGDAAWVDEAIVTYSGHYNGSTVWAVYRVNVGAGEVGNDFEVVLFPSHPAIRSLDMRVNGGAVQVHTGVVNNLSTVYTFTAQPDASGNIDIEYKATDGSSSAYLRAGYVEKVTLVADTTPPAFTATPNVTTTTSTGHSIAATLNEPGTVYGVRLANGAGAPTSAQVKAGQDSTGAAALEAKSSAAANSATLVFSTGSASTAYDYYIVAEDDEATPNLQATPTLVEATTAAAAPTVSTSDATVYPGQSRTVTGTNFGATQGAGGLTVGGVAQTITSWADTSITYTGVRGSNNYASGKTLEITRGDAQTVSTTIEMTTEPGTSAVTMVSPVTDDAASVAYQTTHTVVAPDQFAYKDPNDLGNLVVDSSGLPSADSTGTFPGQWWDAGDQVWGSEETYTFDVVDTVVPQGTITVGTISKTKNSASIPFTYDLTDADSFEHSTDGTTWGTTTSPISRTGLDPDTTYADGQIRAVNSIGAATPVGYSFTTDALAPPSGLITFGAPTITDTTISQPFSYSAGDQTGFEYQVDGGAWQAATSPIQLTSLTADTAYQLDVRAVNADGDGTIATVVRTTDAAPDYTLVVYDKTTIDTTPVVTGTSASATNLVLTITPGPVVYNPVASAGTWSQALSSLAVGEYTMTLEGEDGASNPVPSTTGALIILAPSVGNSGRRGCERRADVAATRDIEGSIEG